MTPKETNPTLAETVQELVELYEHCRRTEITSRRFTQAQMFHWLEPMLNQDVVRPTPLGASAEGRTITLYTHGKGPVSVLLWSQMHGDEPTATMALLDILNFFAQRPEHPVAKSIRDNLTLLIVPMLNPDGAERFMRRTAQLIDMNRDASALVTPEANILKKAQHTYRPHFGFNLHDQDPRMTVGTTKNVTAIALLAPAMDEAREDNEVRMRAKKVAAVFAEVLEQTVRGHAAKYDDTFDPRAFGDSVQRWGTSTVLVESGGWPNDRDKMYIRKLNFVGLLTSLHAIATGMFNSQPTTAYEALPFNSKNLYDVIVRGVWFKGSGQTPPVQTDIAFNIEEQEQDGGKMRFTGKMVDVGDLSRFGAFDDRDGRGKVIDATQFKLDSTFMWEEVELLLK